MSKIILPNVQGLEAGHPTSPEPYRQRGIITSIITGREPVIEPEVVEEERNERR